MGFEPEALFACRLHLPPTNLATISRGWEYCGCLKGTLSMTSALNFGKFDPLPPPCQYQIHANSLPLVISDVIRACPLTSCYAASTFDLSLPVPLPSVKVCPLGGKEEESIEWPSARLISLSDPLARSIGRSVEDRKVVANRVLPSSPRSFAP